MRALLSLDSGKRLARRCTDVDITGVLGTPQRGYSTVEVAALFEQEAEVAGAVGVAVRVRAPVGGLGAVEVAALLQQSTEVGGGGRMAALVGAPEGGFGAAMVAAVV